VAKRRNKHVGSSFDEFLRTEGLYEEVTTLAGSGCCPGKLVKR